MRKLYYEDSHLQEFEATVTSCLFDEKKEVFCVLLDQTAFFPEGGGQLCDLGILKFKENGKEISLPVSDVRIKNEEIIHVVSRQILPGTKVRGEILWERRFDFMQQHSGEHIFSGLIHQRYGADNVGFHLGLTETTLDFNQVFTMEQLREIELSANQAIWKNLSVETSFPDSSSLEKIEYRSKLELTEDVRIVTVPGFDVCACCAPHVKTTGEIGLLKVTGVSSHRGGVRVTILCGKRALSDYTNKQENIFSISSLLSSKQEDAAFAVSRMKSETLSLKEQINLLQTKLLLEKRKMLPSPEMTDHVFMFTEPMNEISIRNAVNDLIEEYKGYVSVFWGDDEKGYRFLIGSRLLDCRSFYLSLKERFDAKGGGKSEMVQGTILASKETLEDFLAIVI